MIYAFESVTVLCRKNLNPIILELLSIKLNRTGYFKPSFFLNCNYYLF